MAAPTETGARRSGERAPQQAGNVVRIGAKAPPGRLPLRVPDKLRRHRGPPVRDEQSADG